jgi:PAS domain S-box-containing protein
MMIDQITPFFRTDLFMPHGHCYLWKPELVGLHILSDALIALAYYSIPLTLFYFVRRRRDLPFTWVFLLFSAFIVACGTTHLLEIWTLWHPTYWLSGGMKLITAIVSLTTAIVLVPIVPQALALPSPAQLALANAALQQEIVDRTRIEAERKQAELKVSRLAAIVESSGDAIIGKDLEGTITSWNASAERLFGYTAAEVIGEPIALLFPPDHTEELAHVLEQIKHGETIESHETVRVRKDGQRLDIAATISPIKDATGQVVGAAKIARDITTRKQAEEAMRQSDRRFRAIFNTMFQFIGLLTPDGILLEANQTALEFAGLTPEDVINRPFWEARWWSLSAATQAQLKAAIAQAATGQFIRYEVDVLGMGETIATIDFSLKPIQDETGKVVLLIPEGRDISDRKQAEASLRRYERIVSATTDAIVLLDRNYTYQSVNQAYLSWHDSQPEDVLGHPVSDLLPLDLYETTVKPQLDQCLAGEVVQYEMWNHYPTLGSQFLSVTYDPYVDADQTISGVVVSLRNITRLKQAEVELQLQSLIVSNIAEGVCMVKVHDGIFVYANPKFERMFGYDPGELIGQHVSIVNYEDRNINTAAIFEQLAGAILVQGEATYEVHNVKKDGSPFWCQATTSVFEHTTYGTVFVVVQQDITERKQAERMLQASLKEKEVLLKEIHHRVKNNLGVVDGLLQMQMRRSQNPEVVETLKESQNRIASIAMVHEKLYGSNDLAEIDFAHYIADLTAHLFDSYNIRSSQIQLTTHIDPVTLDIDTAIPCGLIVNELVSNALKYAFSGTQAGEIQVTLQHRLDQSLALIVRDNGSGLPQGFDFKQAKTLGMTLVKGLVKQLKGTLEINNQPGTTVIITFARDKE